MAYCSFLTTYKCGTHIHTHLCVVCITTTIKNSTRYTNTAIQLFSHHAGILVCDLIAKCSQKCAYSWDGKEKSQKFLFGPFCKLRGYVIQLGNGQNHSHFAYHMKVRATRTLVSNSKSPLWCFIEQNGQI